MATRPSLSTARLAAASALLQETVVTVPPPTVEPSPIPVKAARGTAGYKRPANRVGKRAVMAWVSPETVKQIGIEAIKQERQVGDILIEAINEWFAKRGLQRFD